MRNLNIKSLAILFVISFFYVLPILLANVYYLDDMGRSLYGYNGFHENGRNLAGLVISVFSFGSPLLNPGPVTQILAAFITSFSAYIIVKKLNEDLEEWKCLIISLSFVINPFYLEVLSFNFDSITIALSVLMVSLAFVKYNENLSGMSWYLLGVLCSLFFYQATLSFLIAMVFVIPLCEINKKSLSELTKKIVTQSVIIILAYVIYKSLVTYVFVSHQPELYRGDTLLGDEHLLASLIASIKQNTLVPLSIFAGSDAWVYYLVLMAFVAIPFSVVKSKSADGFFYKFIFSILLVLFTLLSVFLIVSVLRTPVIAARVYVSVSAILFACMFFMVSINVKFVRNAFLVITVGHAYLLSSIYSNLLSAQDRNYRNIAQTLSFDVSKILDKEGKDHVFSIHGTAKPADEVSFAKNKLPVTKYLIQDYIQDNYIWGYMALSLKGVKLPNKNEELYSIEGCINTGIERDWYHICKKDNISVIVF